MTAGALYFVFFVSDDAEGSSSLFRLRLICAGTGKPPVAPRNRIGSSPPPPYFIEDGIEDVNKKLDHARGLLLLRGK